MTGWDPVGAANAPEAWDEYDDYALGVASRLREMDSDEAEAEIFNYLCEIETDRMEVAQTNERSVQTAYIAGALAAWYEFSFTHGSRPPHEWIE